MGIPNWRLRTEGPLLGVMSRGFPTGGCICKVAFTSLCMEIPVRKPSLMSRTTWRPCMESKNLCRNTSVYSQIEILPKSNKQNSREITRIKEKSKQKLITSQTKIA